MSRVRRLILEAHRRSLWQVLAVYLAGSWVALQVVNELTRAAGLPDWVPPAALVLLVIGLPIVMATAVVQEGAPGQGTGQEAPGPAASEAAAAPAGEDRGSEGGEPAPSAPLIRRFLTWRRAILGGVAAFTLLGAAVGGYFFMRVAGVGPVASLVAQGVLDEGEPILLAEFRNATADPLLGSTVTQALRVDLASSGVVTLVEPTQVEDAFRRMGRTPGERLTAELAREIAVRDGIKAVLEGEVGQAGSGFIFTATLRAADGGATLASFRRTARSPDGVIDAVERLSQDIRERVGESLRSIRRGAPLWQVTTPSLEALRSYSEAESAIARGDELGGLALLQEAVALDSAFAMAHRKIAVVQMNLGFRQAEADEAVRRAYRHRDRLTQKERLLTEALYHSQITRDVDAEIRAYEAVLRLDPVDPAALNNLANLHQGQENLEAAEELYRRGLAGPWPAGVVHQNLVSNQLMQGRLEGARAVLDEWAEASPDDPRLGEWESWILAWSGELEAAGELLRERLASPAMAPERRFQGGIALAVLEAVQGRVSLARTEWRRGIEQAGAFGPEAEYFARLADLWIELWTRADSAAARDELARIRRSGLPARVRGAAPQHDVGVHVHIMAGDRAGGREVLELWREAAPPERVTPAMEATWDLYGLWLERGGEDPEAVLDALAQMRRVQRCPSCLMQEEAWLLERAGRPAEARERWERIADRPVPGGGGMAASFILVPAALEAAGRLADEAGDTAAAVRHYGRFVELWSDADPELRPRVERARARMEALGG